MRLTFSVKILTLATLGLLVLPSMIPTSHISTTTPVMASYNPAPANSLHAPLSAAGIIGLSGAKPNAENASSQTSWSGDPSNLQTIHQNAVRFVNDTSYFPQSETTVAVDPNNLNHVVGGFNDAKFFFCGVLPQDCGNNVPASISGFTTSTDGGRTVAKGSDLPDVSANGVPLVSWGDPSLAPSVDGNFYYASLAINSFSSIFGNGIMIAKSNANLFNPNVSCVTSASSPYVNPCWNAVFINGSTAYPVFTFEDKDRISVDRDPTSPYYGSVYVGWDHFFIDGTSASYLARCTPSLSSCTMISPIGSDIFVAWTTPVVDKNGNVYVSWCNFGTFTTYGPVTCRIRSSPPGGNNFGPASNVLSYMGAGTQLPSDTVVIGWATEQFRTGAGLISVSADLSPRSNNLYFTTTVCSSGHYYALSPAFAPVAADNPGDCGQSSIIFTVSTNNGQTWSSPISVSKPAVNDQAYVTVDPTLGIVYVVYYTTQYDQFNHRIDVAASVSFNLGKTFHQVRVTSVSDEPNSDPNMYNYVTPSGFGGSFSVPQYGDYFEATARWGVLWVLFTGNYAVEQGTFQTDPFLAVANPFGQNSQ
jgi:hypothetical protein